MLNYYIKTDRKDQGGTLGYETGVPPWLSVEWVSLHNFGLGRGRGGVSSSSAGAPFSFLAGVRFLGTDREWLTGKDSR